MRLAATLRAADDDDATVIGIGAFNPPVGVDDVFGSGTGAFLTVRLAGIPEDMPSRLEVPDRYAEATLAGRDDIAAFLLLLLLLMFDVDALFSADILFCTLLLILFDDIEAEFGNASLVVLGLWLLLLLFIVVGGVGVVVIVASVLIAVEIFSITGCGRMKAVYITHML